MNMVLQSINEGVMTFFSFLIALIPLVIVHELGHLLMAKKLGVWAREFGIGFPPRIMRLFHWNETEFTLNWLPLGGFVRLEGESFFDEENAEAQEQKTPEELAETAERKRRSLYAQSLSTRFWVYVAGPLMNLALAWLLAVQIFAIGVPLAPITVVAVTADSPAMVSGLQVGDHILAVNNRPLNAYFPGEGVEMFIDYVNAHLEQPIEIAIERDGQPFQIMLTPQPTPPEGEGPLGVQLSLHLAVSIAAVAPGSPAEQSGLQVGDRLLAVDGIHLWNGNVLIEYTREHTGETIMLTIERDGERQDVPLLARANPPAGEGALGIQMLHQTTDYTRYPLPQAFMKGTSYGLTLLLNTLTLPISVIRGLIPAEVARPVGVVGISQIAYETIQQSLAAGQWFPFLNVVLLISLSLGIFNLLPIPALDGGRILFILLEKVRGKPIPPEKEEKVHMIALISLLVLFVVITLLDIFFPVF